MDSNYGSRWNTTISFSFLGCRAWRATQSMPQGMVSSLIFFFGLLLFESWTLVRLCFIHCVSNLWSWRVSWFVSHFYIFSYWTFAYIHTVVILMLICKYGYCFVEVCYIQWYKFSQKYNGVPPVFCFFTMSIWVRDVDKIDYIIIE